MNKTHLFIVAGILLLFAAQTGKNKICLLTLVKILPSIKKLEVKKKKICVI